MSNDTDVDPQDNKSEHEIVMDEFHVILNHRKRQNTTEVNPSGIILAVPGADRDTMNMLREKIDIMLKIEDKV